MRNGCRKKNKTQMSKIRKVNAFMVSFKKSIVKGMAPLLSILLRPPSVRLLSAAVTNEHKHSGMQQPKVILLQSRGRSSDTGLSRLK